ncbi:ribosomal protein S3 (BS3) [[Clostridium] ultunense Esp]|uniref:30S ribosomal protein S3 n=1 Tax=Thermicanus aegyptius TaxID=94009 RepID=UPI0002B6FCED|nr:30S ribosomal protein S3 [Thermicanus aegyptius]CCQ93744.1 ribosomal protein S3 (BS3) [[Clostridium] ultunense Esp]
MGQKVSPVGLRIGIIRDWESRWYAEKDFAALLHEDLKIRKFLEEKLADAGISHIEIERAANRLNLTLHTAKPGMVIGKGGQEIENLRNAISKMTDKKVHINVNEIKKPDLDAKLVAESIAKQLENRVSFRRAMKQAMQRVMRAGAKGVKVAVSGRLGGAEIARTEGYSEGTVPLHTLRADIDFAIEEAHTTYGVIGVKVWIYRGEVLPVKGKAKEAAEGGN